MSTQEVKTTLNLGLLVDPYEELDLEALSRADVLNDLYTRLYERNLKTQLARDYFDGRYRVDFLAPKLRQAFNQTLRVFGRNLISHIVKVEADRLRVDGFVPENGDQALATRAWATWRASDMSSLAHAAFEESIVVGTSYLSADPATGLVHSESSANTYVYADPATRRRLGALKIIDHGETLTAFLYAPGWIATYTAKTTPMFGVVTNRGLPDWTLVEVVKNEADVVPIIPLHHEPDVRTREGTSGVLPLIESVDFIHGLLVAQAVATELGAWPQKFVTGVEIPKDESGKPLPAIQLEASQARLWSFEPADATVGALPTTDLGQFSNAITDAVRLLASLSRTPQPALIMDLVNVSDKALVTSQASFVAKVEGAQESFSTGIAEAVGIALGVSDQRIEPTWRPAAQWDPLMVAQAAQVEAAVNLPLELIWSRMGLSPQEVAVASDRFRSLPPAGAAQ